MFTYIIQFMNKKINTEKEITVTMNSDCLKYLIEKEFLDAIIISEKSFENLLIITYKAEYKG